MKLIKELAKTHKNQNVSDLSERCYACDETLADFEQLMKHRREKHSATINV